MNYCLILQHMRRQNCDLSKLVVCPGRIKPPFTKCKTDESHNSFRTSNFERSQFRSLLTYDNDQQLFFKSPMPYQFALMLKNRIAARFAILVQTNPVYVILMYQRKISIAHHYMKSAISHSFFKKVFIAHFILNGACFFRTNCAAP